MKAWVCRQFGSPESLLFEELPSPRPGDGEIVVSVKAASANFPDILMLQDKYQHRPGLPFTPGYELAGVVESTGAGVQGVRPGDHGVAIVRAGAFAQQAVVPADRFWRIPHGIDMRLAAAFPLAYGTSYHALKDRGQLQPGETLVVLGAAGGVGLAAVQLGKLMGARVIACASSAERLAVCKAHGADELVNYRTEDLRSALKRLAGEHGVDVVCDPVGGGYTETAVRCMAWGGRYLVIGFTAGEVPRLPLNLPLLKGCSIVGVAWDTYSRRNPAGGARNIAELAAWIDAGKLVPVIGATYPLADAPAALNDIMHRRVQGKAVVVV